MEFCYPYGKIRAMTFSYDDGEIYDRNLISLFNQYEVKSTFHLNAGWLDTRGYITREELPTLYNGHEIAGHGFAHRYLRQLPPQELLREIINDRTLLEQSSNRFVRGFSYAFGEFSDSIIDTLKTTGLVYARTASPTGKFEVPSNFMKWNPTCHHEDNIDRLLKSFLNPPAYRKMSLMYIYGHSFEFERNKNWHLMESFLKKAAGNSDTWYASNIEIYDYLLAIQNLIISMDGHHIQNNSLSDIWINYNTKLLCVHSGETITLN